MNNRQLEYFAETVKLKSFTKAANKLFVTQSALSKAIQSLESELGTVLIDRGAKDFQLTRDGETVFVYASESNGVQGVQTRLKRKDRFESK
jgi:DNA-binding transcriptional LysR family regulator